MEGSETSGADGAPAKAPRQLKLLQTLIVGDATAVRQIEQLAAFRLCPNGRGVFRTLDCLGGKFPGSNRATSCGPNRTTILPLSSS